MNLKEAIAVANQFNDTIFTNTQEMVNAVTVLIDYAESNKPEPITGNWLISEFNEIIDETDLPLARVEVFEILAERINKRGEKPKEGPKRWKPKLNFTEAELRRMRREELEDDKERG